VDGFELAEPAFRQSRPAPERSQSLQPRWTDESVRCPPDPVAVLNGRGANRQRHSRRPPPRSARCRTRATI
jgi:hypothetical protein